MLYAVEVTPFPKRFPGTFHFLRSEGEALVWPDRDRASVVADLLGLAMADTPGFVARVVEAPMLRTCGGLDAVC